ncbi:hypothetical protein LIER_43695 [Lithospermum erythrorhizon]|uniref:Uncharacterized protein n=1 Tax=Lithospermum erythrorhizon TaxID=34254 RepID=A0AAV3QP52_LITER
MTRIAYTRLYIKVDAKDDLSEFVQLVNHDDERCTVGTDAKKEVVADQLVDKIVSKVLESPTQMVREIGI